jgi:hypothetical protein
MARPVKGFGQASPRTWSNTVVRSVSSPPAAAIRALALACPSASAAA